MPVTSKLFESPLQKLFDRPLGGRVSGGISYSAEATALFARFSTPPTTARKSLIDNLIVALKTAGVWPLLDGLYVLAAADAQSSLLNWVQNLYNCTAVSAPTFAADRGYTADGLASYLETGFNPTTAVSPKFTLNDAHMGLWSRTNLANGAGTSFDFGDLARSAIGRSTVSGTAVGRPNIAGNTTLATGAYPGHAAWARSAAAVWEGYAQGIDAGGGVNASVSVNNTSFRILAEATTGFGVNEIAAAHMGGNLTAGQMLATKNALNTYLQGVGAA